MKQKRLEEGVWGMEPAQAPAPVCERRSPVTAGAVGGQANGAWSMDFVAGWAQCGLRSYLV